MYTAAQYSWANTFPDWWERNLFMATLILALGNTRTLWSFFRTVVLGMSDVSIDDSSFGLVHDHLLSTRKINFHFLFQFKFLYGLLTDGIFTLR